MSDEHQPISDYYAGKSIFVTGGTGFVGSVLIEKLLYSCPDVGNIYVLVREKRGVSPAERVKNLVDSPVFDRLKAERPENLKKIIPVVGDLTKLKIGMSIEDLQILQEQVSVVFHLAATVKFNEPLSVAVEINVESAKEIISVCHTMRKIEIFVYMSTIFSNTDHEVKTVVEELYPSPKPMDEVYAMITENDPNETFSSEVLNGRANTYTFSKALAENVIAEKRGDLPTVMIRPAVVTAAKDEPMKGWISSWMGPTPILTFMAKGWLRCLYGKEEYSFPIIPVDYVANLTIVAAARHNRSKEMPIYNLCSSGDNRITLKNAKNGFVKESYKEIFYDLPWPGMLFTTSEWLLFLIRLLFQTIPLYLGDFILFLFGRPIRCVKILNKLERCMAAIKYFSSRDWSMDISQTKKLISTLSENDKKKFPCNPRDINWEEYIATYFYGIKKYLLHDEKKKV